MARYRVKLGSVDGSTREFFQDAFHPDEVVAAVDARRYLVLEIEDTSTLRERLENWWNHLGQSVSDKEIVFLARFLKTMLAAGLSLNEALGLLQRQAANPYLAHILGVLLKKISAGEGFSDALSAFEGVFGRGFTRSVRAGELTGNLEQVLDENARSLEKNLLLRKKILAAMVYPCFLILLCFVATWYIVSNVIPEFQDLFQSFGSELPDLTRYLLNFSAFVSDHSLPIVVTLLTLAMVLTSYATSREGGRVIDGLICRLPFVGDLAREYNVSLLSRSLSAALKSGISLVEGLAIAGESLGNGLFRDALSGARRKIEGGVPLEKSLADESLFPRLWLQLVRTGEETGSLCTLLANGADFYENEADGRVVFMVSLVEPFLLIFILAFLALLVLALFIPILSAAGQIK